MTARDKAFYVSYAAWLLGVFAFFLPAATWNPVSRLSLTRAIVERGELSIDAYSAGTGDRALADGRWYTDKTPVPSLIAVPPYAAVRLFDRVRGTSPEFLAIGTPETPAQRLEVNRAFRRALYVCSLSTAGVAGAAMGLLLFVLMRRRDFAPLTSLVASSAIVLGTPILPYATSFYGHAIAGAFLLGAIVCLDGLGTDAQAPHATARVRGAGACLALAAGSEYLIAIPAAIIGLFFLGRSARGTRLSAVGNLALGAAGPILVVVTYQTLCYGAPWRTGYSFIARPEFARGHASGFLGIALPRADATWGLLFGPTRGLFYIAPIALIGAAGLLVRAVRSREWAVQAALSGFLALLVLNAGYYMWWGGAAAGPRHLVPVLPIFALGVAGAWQIRWLRVPCAVLAAISIANALAISAVGLEAPEFDDILLRYAWPRLLAGNIARLSGASNIGLELGLRGSASLWPLLGWFVLGFAYLWRTLRTEATVEPAR